MAESNTPATGEDVSVTDLGDDADLRPEGEKALEAWKQRAKTAEQAARDAVATAQERDSLKAELAKVRNETKSQAEKERDKAVRAAEERVRAEVTTAADRRLVRSEVRVAAAGKLTDPEDAVQFLNLDEFKVGSDGEVDTKVIASAIDALMKEKPYLAANGHKPIGDVDQGARGAVAPKVEPGLGRLTHAYAQSGGTNS